MTTVETQRNLTIWEAMVLIVGAAIGLYMTRGMSMGGEEYMLEGAGWRYLTWAASINVLAGLTMAGTVLILIDRLGTGRHWRTATILWFAMGLLCWMFAGVSVLSGWRGFGHSGYIGPWFDGGLFHDLPMIAAALLVACLTSRRTLRRWWACRGWWPDWTGMWVLLLFTLSGVLQLVFAWLVHLNPRV